MEGSRKGNRVQILLGEGLMNVQFQSEAYGLRDGWLDNAMSQTALCYQITFAKEAYGMRASLMNRSDVFRFTQSGFNHTQAVLRGRAAHQLWSVCDDVHG